RLTGLVGHPRLEHADAGRPAGVAGPGPREAAGPVVPQHRRRRLAALRAERELLARARDAAALAGDPADVAAHDVRAQRALVELHRERGVARAQRSGGPLDPQLLGLAR